MTIKSFLYTTALVVTLAVQSMAFAQSDRVDINTANADQMADILVGIGPSKAQAIVNYRQEFGAFEDVEELINVRGIGLRTVDQNRDRLSLGEQP
ncbi:MAG: helix-hairpin-helix domain-containing protein [Wenzhouxiangella sp.]|jgi:competence protein ComEA|nr:helix-hairpin-helix domain-containing protein [Wenzhouxiangella sp.]MDR9452578.1 helix-hairpin-helix domain-containing protein [Wenzhouxiangella sp.]